MSSSAITGPVLSDTRRAPSGTAAAPSFAFNDSTGTGVYLVSPGVLGLSTAGVQRVVVTAAGDVGIGTASPSGVLHINKSNTSTGTVYLNGATTSADFMRIKNTGGDVVFGVENSVGASIVAGSSAYASVIYTVNSTPLQFGTNSIARMALDTSGGLNLVNSGGTGCRLVNISQSLANGATITVASGSLGGFVMIRIAAAGTERYTIFSAHAGGNSTAQLVTGGLGAGTTAVLNTTNTVNFAFSGGNYVLQNNAGGTVTVNILIQGLGGF